ncbi:MAG: hypothetical protein IKO85_00770 [Bacteroidaceae bacterium]|nr:hypothetical protein [Bacteroidaceae bacterium]
MTVKEYFTQLATEHTLIRHSEAEPHFACSMDDAATLMAHRLLYPALFLDEGNLLVTGDNGNEQAALVVGLRLKRAELGIGYDLRLHAPSVTLKYDIWQWQ